MKTAPISLEKVQAFIQPEFLHLCLILSLISWIIYRVLLKKVSEERHRNLQNLFKNLTLHLGVGLTFFGCYSICRHFLEYSKNIERMAVYFGFMTLIWGLIVIIKASRILLFEYLFLGHMKVPVPVLLVNIFTLILSFGLFLWTATEVFSIRLTPVLATSALLSIVVGLALQDTLGNLFAGVSLQFDKPYEIGDWIEVQNGSQKWIGQVREISWRATLLLGFTDELMTIPNRVITMSQISNWSGRTGPVIRTQLFRIPFGADIQKVKQTLLKGGRSSEAILVYPPALVLLSEASESWLTFKLVYFIEDFGKQYLIADEVITKAVQELAREGIPFAVPRLQVDGSLTNSSNNS